MKQSKDRFDTVEEGEGREPILRPPHSPPGRHCLEPETLLEMCTGL